MLHLSRKSLLALEAVVDVAIHSRPDPVQSKEITARQGVPQRYLEQVMQHLVRSGILRGVRGPRGGYRLARERRRITVGEVLRTVAEIEGGDVLLGEGSDLGQKVVRPLIEEMQEKLMRRLDQVTIEDLCRRAEESGCGEARAFGHDFTI